MLISGVFRSKQLVFFPNKLALSFALNQHTACVHVTHDTCRYLAYRSDISGLFWLSRYRFHEHRFSFSDLLTFRIFILFFNLGFTLDFFRINVFSVPSVLLRIDVVAVLLGFSGIDAFSRHFIHYHSALLLPPSFRFVGHEQQTCRIGSLWLP